MASNLEQQRKAFVKEQVSKGMDRQTALKRFYVQTRVSELTAAGKPVNADVRARLRANWDSGNVKRAVFLAPSRSSSSAPSKPLGPQRTGPETKSYAGRGVRTGPESGSYTKPKPSRTGPESKSYTKPKANNVGGPKEMPKRAPNVTPNMETKKPSSAKPPVRTGPEGKSYTKPGQPKRTGPETGSYIDKRRGGGPRNAK